MRKFVALALALMAVIVVAGCTSGTSSTKASGSNTTAGSTNTTAASAEAAQAPGVTANSVKVGVTFVDASSLKATGLNLNLGDYQTSYQTLVNQINNQGGINGRKIQLVFTPINPVGTAPADAACLRLTEDEKVFVAVGFFLNDAVLCPVATHDTAVVGGTQTPELMAQAKAPWFTTNAGSEVPVNVVKAFDKKDLLTGKVAVFAQVADQDVYNAVNAELTKLGIKPVAKGLLDAPASDNAAVISGTQVIAQRFKAEGATKVLLVGPSSADWFLAMENQPWQPQLLASDTSAVQSFLANASTTNTSLLKGSYEGGAYGSDSWVITEPQMAACVKTLKAAGIAVPNPDPNDPDNKAYTGPEDACVNVTLLKAILEKAGKTLNYATFRNAGYTLGKITIPGDPTPRVYGPPPATDGNPTAYLAAWDPTKKQYVIEQG